MSERKEEDGNRRLIIISYRYIYICNKRVDYTLEVDNNETNTYIYTSIPIPRTKREIRTEEDGCEGMKKSVIECTRERKSVLYSKAACGASTGAKDVVPRTTIDLIRAPTRFLSPFQCLSSLVPFFVLWLQAIVLFAILLNQIRIDYWLLGIII